MRKLVSILSSAFVYCCVATVVSLVAMAGTLWFKGALDQGRLYRVLAALHGIDIMTLHEQLAAEEEAFDAEQVSYDAVLQARRLKSLDLDLRETAVEKGLLDLTNLQHHLHTQQTRFQDLSQSYDQRLKELADEEEATSLRELQLTLEAMKPKQAKVQIVKMMDDDGMDDVVAVIKRMPVDKRKKLLAEFKQGDDTEKLYEILTNIRLGEPMTTQLQEARDKLKQFSPTATKSP